jgi:hypothetical protein
MPFRSAFFAFPNQPDELKLTIVSAVELANKRDDLRVQSWPQLPIFGAAIPDTVKDAIQKTDILVCDITKANLNVYYEVGYCIGLAKSIAPVINVSFANSIAEIQKDGLFDIIGYGSYTDAAGLAELLETLPSTVLLDLYGRPLNTNQPIYFLSTHRRTEFVNWIATAIKDSKVNFRTFDPAETPRFSIITAISDITSSAGVVVPFLESYVEDAERHNIRAAFVAGLANGLGREALLTRFGTAGAAPAAADFREDVEVFSAEGPVTARVIDFCKNTLIAAQSIRSPRGQRAASALQRLSLGATAAENEFKTLENYFVETAEYLRTARGEVEIVAGRKGSGKTAIFFMVRNSFRDQKNSVLSDLRPESHQLSLFKSELIKIVDAGAFDHTIAGFWYFLVLSEILLSLKREIAYRARQKSELFKEVEEMERELARFGISESGDFTARINRLSSYVIDEIRRCQQAGEGITTDKLTNIVYRGGIADAKKFVLRHAGRFEHIVFLFDNIDKGWATDGVDQMDVRLVRLLIEALEKVKRDLAVDHCDFRFVVFLRNDVFELMVSGTPDKGKAAVIRIDWTDRVKLKQVIQFRLQASLVERVRNFNEIWERFFVPAVGGKDSFDFFVDHCLMRPRFLIEIIEYAIATAINRGHEKVLEEDCLDAVREHSYSILNDFAYEIRDVSGAAETVMDSLVGATNYVTKDEVLERFERARIIDTKDGDKLFQYMLWYGVLGVVNQNNVECYIYDFNYNMNRLVAEAVTQKEEPLYVFNPALHVALKAKRPSGRPLTLI